MSADQSSTDQPPAAPPFPPGLDTARFPWHAAIDRAVDIWYHDPALSQVAVAVIQCLAAIHAALAPDASSNPFADPLVRRPSEYPLLGSTWQRKEAVGNRMFVVSLHPSRDTMPAMCDVSRGYPAESTDTFVGLRKSPRGTATLYVETRHFKETWKRVSA